MNYCLLLTTTSTIALLAVLLVIYFKISSAGKQSSKESYWCTGAYGSTMPFEWNPYGWPKPNPRAIQVPSYATQEQANEWCKVVYDIGSGIPCNTVHKNSNTWYACSA